jgi:CheY-like chemotaxis protein
MFPGPRARSTQGRILVVDDEPILLRSTERLLEQRGFSVATAMEAAGAVELVEGGAVFDVLVVDVALRGVTGLELARRLRERLPNLRVLYVSGFDAGALRLDTGRAGDAFLAKPFAGAELARRLTELLPEPPNDPAASSDVTTRDSLG